MSQQSARCSRCDRPPTACECCPWAAAELGWGREFRDDGEPYWSPFVEVRYGQQIQMGQSIPAMSGWTFFKEREGDLAAEFKGFLNSDRIFDCRIPTQFLTVMNP